MQTAIPVVDGALEPAGQGHVELALGADGAPGNNRLSMLGELRQAALLQNLAAGPGAWTAAQALWNATRGGAEALGLDDEVGSLRPGLRADLVLLAADDPFLGAPSLEPDALAAAVATVLPSVLQRAGLAR